MPTARIHDRDVHFERAGGGMAMILLHQDGMSVDVWRPLLPTLAGDFDVIAVDRPGHGQSAAPADPRAREVERAAAWLASLIDTLGLQRPALFGASGGALIALEYALTNPRGTPFLVLAEPPLHGLSHDFPIDREGFSAAHFAHLLEREGSEAMVRSFLGTMLTPSRVELVLRSPGGRAMIESARELLLRAIEANERYAPGPRLRALRCPTLVLTGERSNALFRSVERVLTAEIPRCAAVRLPAVDHASLLSPTAHLVRTLRAIAKAIECDSLSSFAEEGRLN